MADKPVIDKLTPEQETLLQQYHERWFGMGICTEPADREVAEDAIHRLYKELERDTPPIRWVSSPYEAKQIIQAEADDPDNAIGTSIWGQLDSYWIAMFEFCDKVLGIEYEETPYRRLGIQLDLARSCGWVWVFDTCCIVCDRMSEVHFNEDENGQKRLHNDSGPAVAYRDGYKIWALNGMIFENNGEKIIMAPETLTVEEIEGETNVEVRRVMLERHGEANFIEEAGLVPEQQDDYGKLYRKVLEGDEDMVYVRVVNSTPEPKKHPDDEDEFKIAWIRVPPTMRTARQAVAWSFKIDKPEMYNPVVQT